MRRNNARVQTLEIKNNNTLVKTWLWLKNKSTLNTVSHAIIFLMMRRLVKNKLISRRRLMHQIPLDKKRKRHTINIIRRKADNSHKFNQIRKNFPRDIIRDPAVLQIIFTILFEINSV